MARPLCPPRGREEKYHEDVALASRGGIGYSRFQLSSPQFVRGDQRVARRQCLPVGVEELVDDDAGADVAGA